MGNRVCAVIVGAGSSSRFKKQKLLEKIDGVTVLERSVAAFARHPLVDSIVLAVSAELMPFASGLKYGQTTVLGGASRLESVKNAVSASDAEFVCIHDAARPFVSEELISRVIYGAFENKAAAPFVPVSDSLRELEGGYVSGVIDRMTTFAAQTPQMFRRDEYSAALALAAGNETDDCEVALGAGISVFAVSGEPTNKKITYEEDLPMSNEMRIGHGYDAHRLVEGRRLVLGGVEIPHTLGLDGHSDADVAAHALIDALLGAAGLSDIGSHFPDSDPRYKDVDSMVLLASVCAELGQKGFSIVNADVTIIAQAPKLAPYREAMAQALANAMRVERGRVNVKATTEEGMGFTGEKLGIAAHSCVLLRI